MAQTVVPWVPLWAYDAWVARGVDWLVMSEDLPRFDNRVTVEPDGRIRLTYRPNNLGSHRTLVRRWSRLLKEIGFWVVMARTSHKAQRTRRTSAGRWSSATIRGLRCSIRSAAATTWRTCSSWTRPSSPRRRR